MIQQCAYRKSTREAIFTLLKFLKILITSYEIQLSLFFQNANSIAP